MKSKPFHLLFRPFLITLPIVIILLALSAWQFHRATWKHDLLAHIAAQQNAPVMRNFLQLSPEQLDYRHVEISGTIDRGAGFKLYPRTYNGKAGAHWLVPMVSSFGVVVMVNTGWVPDGWQPPTGTMQSVEMMSGTFRFPPAPNAFTPANPADGNTIYRVDMQWLKEKLGAEPFPLILYADKFGDQPPIGGQAVLELPNNHIQYAFTWLVLAVAVIVIYILARTKHN